MEQSSKPHGRKASKMAVKRTQGKLCPREVPTKLIKIRKDNHSKSLKIDQRPYSKLRNIYSTKSMTT